MPTERDADIVVVGAGLVGAACALRLADSGRSVLLLDAQPAGRGASFGNAGHVATEQLFPLASAAVIRASWRYLLDADSPLRVRAAYLLPILPWLARFVWAARPAAYARGVAALVSLQRSSRVDLRDLLVHAGIAPLLHLDGYFRAYESALGERTALSQAAELAPFGIRTERVSGGDLHIQMPALSPAIAGAVLYPDTGHVEDPYAVCVGLVAALLRKGGEFRQQRVLRLAQQRDGPVTLTLDQGAALRCKTLVLCAGAWSRPLAASLGYRVPLDTERGYHITVPRSHASDDALPPPIRVPIASTERKVIMTPMAVGLRMTGTVEFGGLHLPPDPHRFALLRAQMKAMLPAVDVSQASEWMGFRPSLPDHLPVLGAAPRHRGVYFAFGHQHLGLALCGVTARLVADLVQGRKPDVAMEPFRVDRF
ncbi:MAG: FAD-dependent oxidoreductase [Burkholderiaceae bacterium]